jgi:hypothetical protein
MQKVIAEKRSTFNVQRWVESETNMAPLKDSLASVMHECESVATGAGCKRDLAGFLVGLNLAWTAMAGAVLLMVLAQRDTHNVLKLVDWHLLQVVFLGLRALWNSDHHFDDRCRRGRATCSALRRACAARR